MAKMAISQEKERGLWDVSYMRGQPRWLSHGRKKSMLVGEEGTAKMAIPRGEAINACGRGLWPVQPE